MKRREGERDPLLSQSPQPNQHDDDENDEASCKWVKARHALAFWAFLGFFNVYCLRVNLSVALVAMVNTTSSDNKTINDECPGDVSPKNSTKASTGEYTWDENTQGLILGAFFYGYIITQLPGGWMAERIGGKKLFGLGILCTSVLTLLTPLAAKLGVPCLVALRVLEGIGEGVTFPSMHAIWARWAPVYERSKLASFTYAGAQLGTVFSMPISGLLCDYGFAGGWPSVFYVFGALGCVWVVCWLLFVYDEPTQHPRITQAEKKFILSSIGHKEKVSTPWKHIFTCPALWGIVAAHFTNTWGLYSMLTCLPTYMKNVLKFNMQQSGFLSALPYLLMWFFQIMSGYIADFLRERGYLSTRNTRKLMNSLGCILPAIFLVAVSYSGCNHTMAVVFLTLGVGTSGFSMAGYMVNHLDIAPRVAGTLLGITNMFATISGFLSPQIVGVLTNHRETSGQWRIFFFLSAGIYVGGCLLFLILAQGEEQDWAKGKLSASSVVTQEQAVTTQHSSLQEDGGAGTRALHYPDEIDEDESVDSFLNAKRSSTT